MAILKVALSGAQWVEGFRTIGHRWSWSCRWRSRLCAATVSAFRWRRLQYHGQLLRHVGDWSKQRAYNALDGATKTISSRLLVTEVDRAVGWARLWVGWEVKKQQRLDGPMSRVRSLFFSRSDTTPHHMRRSNVQELHCYQGAGADPRHVWCCHAQQGAIGTKAWHWRSATVWSRQSNDCHSAENDYRQSFFVFESIKTVITVIDTGRYWVF